MLKSNAERLSQTFSGCVIKNIPNLSISREIEERISVYDQDKDYLFRYRAKHHQDLPHVVKFSGGRSSGMLLFVLLENGMLDQSRGDVIVFNNTSAEHPKTYSFVQDCIRASQSYGIPFFQIEFQTYEDSRRGVYTRLPSYRLVNDQPVSPENPDGFHCRGEVFQELLSWTGYVPNQFNRICTKHLKLEATRDFLSEWFTGNSSIPRLGHFGNASRMDADESYERHLSNQGSVPREIYLKKRSYAWQRPHFRPRQMYSSFCQDWATFENPILARKTIGDKVKLGVGEVEYVAFIGLRGDEMHRVQRVADRDASEAGYDGEHIYMPLADLAITKEDVNGFWSQQEWDLALSKDISLSNCVYCFLKGFSNLKKIHRAQQETLDTESFYGPVDNTPCDLAWWQRIERDYSRNLVAEGREIRSKIQHIGFFGNKVLSYDSIADDEVDLAGTDEALPCDCTE